VKVASAELDGICEDEDIRRRRAVHDRAVPEPAIHIPTPTRNSARHAPRTRAILTGRQLNGIGQAHHTNWQDLIHRRASLSELAGAVGAPTREVAGSMPRTGMVVPRRELDDCARAEASRVEHVATVETGIGCPCVAHGSAVADTCVLGVCVKRIAGIGNASIQRSVTSVRDVCVTSTIDGWTGIANVAITNVVNWLVVDSSATDPGYGKNR
jgi:hypothetical protein